MFGVGRGISTLLVGWLWADILLGLFVIFLAASAAPAQDLALAKPTDRSIDPQPVVVTMGIDPAALLGTDANATALEQTRIATEVTSRIGADRDVALVLAFASQDDPVLGDRLAARATAGLHGAHFTDAIVKAMHSIVAGDPGSTLSLEVYLFR